MEYEGQICRPPMEKSSFMLPVSVGCSYNACTFCILFKHLRYRILPLDQIEAELRRVRDLGGNPGKVFLGDGNAFSMETSRLLCIVDMICHYFSKCRVINMDATVSDIRKKTDDELRDLREAGIRDLYLGVECGLDDVLAFMRKDHDTAEALLQIQRMRDVGLVFNAHIMTGIAGHGRGVENAKALAAFFNRTRPKRIVNFSLFLHRFAPLHQDILSGAFRPADEVENLREAHTLLESLESDLLSYDGYHDRLGLRVWGELGQERQKMLKKLQGAIAAFSSKAPILAYAE